MSRGWKKYGEARLYLIGGSVGLLAILWSVLFARDHSAVGLDAAQVPVIEASVAASAPKATSSQNPTGVPAQVPQTKTRGS